MKSWHVGFASHVTSEAVLCRTVLLCSVSWCVSPDRPADPAIANKQLPAGIDRSKWRAGSWTVEECVCYPRSAASTEQCRTRTQKPLEEARRLLQELSESVWPSGSVFESISMLLIPFLSSRFCKTTVTQADAGCSAASRVPETRCRVPPFYPKWIHPDMLER